MKIYYCRKCNVELTDENWYASRKREKRYICKKCLLESQKTERSREVSRRAGKKYRLNHSEKVKDMGKTYIKKNRDKINEYRRRYIKLDYVKDKRNSYRREWLKTPKGKISNKRIKSKRRFFGFNPLNIYFDGCEAHHINEIDVIYIPKTLHSIFCGKHTQKNTVSLIAINYIAFFFLVQQNIIKLNKYMEE